MQRFFLIYSGIEPIVIAILTGISMAAFCKKKKQKIACKYFILAGLCYLSEYFSFNSTISGNYGLQFPQGLYPIATASSLVPYKGSLFFSFMSEALLHVGWWNFFVFLFAIYVALSVFDVLGTTSVSVFSSFTTGCCSELPYGAEPSSA